VEAAVPSPPRAVRTPERREADVLVIGAGVIGAACAYYLSRAGVGVLIAERGEPNLQASGANAGSLHVQLLSFDFGVKAQAGGGPAAATLALGPPSVALWREIEKESGEDLEIRTTGGLMVAETDEELRFLEAKVALERRYRIGADMIDRAELRRIAPALSERLVGAELCHLEGKINPLTATYAVLRLGQAKGARLVTNAEVTSIERDGARFRVATTAGEVRCGRIVNAAGPWTPHVGRMVGLALPVHGAPLQMIVTEPATKLVPQLVAHAGRHLSLKQADAGGFVIGGGWTATTDPATGFPKTLRRSIEGNLWVARRVLPALDGLHVVRSWAAMNVNLDGAPLIGEAAPGFFNAVTANGYTLAPIVGRLTAEMMRGETPSLDVRPFLLSRFG
jgi:glycine/D-amino acid oxidase-like deaminating enzyme